MGWGDVKVLFTCYFYISPSHSSIKHLAIKHLAIKHLLSCLPYSRQARYEALGVQQ